MKAIGFPDHLYNWSIVLCVSAICLTQKRSSLSLITRIHREYYRSPPCWCILYAHILVRITILMCPVYPSFLRNSTLLFLQASLRVFLIQISSLIAAPSLCYSSPAGNKYPKMTLIKPIPNVERYSLPVHRLNQVKSK